MSHDEHILDFWLGFKKIGYIIIISRPVGRDAFSLEGIYIVWSWEHGGSQTVPLPHSTTYYKWAAELRGHLPIVLMVYGCISMVKERKVNRSSIHFKENNNEETLGIQDRYFRKCNFKMCPRYIFCVTWCFSLVGTIERYCCKTRRRALSHRAADYSV